MASAYSALLKLHFDPLIYLFCSSILFGLFGFFCFSSILCSSGYFCSFNFLRFSSLYPSFNRPFSLDGFCYSNRPCSSLYFCSSNSFSNSCCSSYFCCPVDSWFAFPSSSAAYQVFLLSSAFPLSLQPSSVPLLPACPLLCFGGELR